MPDTIQDRATLTGELADNTTGNISAQTMRNWLLSSDLSAEAAAKYVPKASPTTNNNLAILDASGNVKDGGTNLTNFACGSLLVVTTSTFNNAANFNGNTISMHAGTILMNDGSGSFGGPLKMDGGNIVAAGNVSAQTVSIGNTVTASAPAFAVSQTWNGSTTFSAAQITVSIANGQNTSYILDTQVNGNHYFTVEADGQVKAGASAHFVGNASGLSNVPSSAIVRSIGSTTFSPISTAALGGSGASANNCLLGNSTWGTPPISASNFASQSANSVLAGPQFGPGFPSFRTLTLNDIPDLGGTYLPLSTGGTLNGPIDMAGNSISDVASIGCSEIDVLGSVVFSDGGSLNFGSWSMESGGSISSKVLKSLSADGIPIVAELARQYHTTAEGVKDLASTGQIGFDQLKKAFETMTGPGGRFAGIVAAQNNTIGGLLHTLSATTADTLADVAETIINAFNLRDAISYVSQGLQGIGGKFSSFVTTYAPVVRQIAGEAIQSFVAIFDAATTIGSQIFGAVAGVWNQIYGFVSPIVSAIATTISANWVTIVSDTVGFVMGVYDAISGAFTGALDLVSQIWTGIQTAFATGWQFVTGTTVQAGDENKTVFQSLASVASWLSEALTTTFNTIGFAFSHWRDVANVVMLGVAFDVVRLGNQIVYVFTGIVWPSLQWAGAQFLDFAKLSGTIFENLGHNLVAVFSNLKGLITGKVSFSDIWKPLTDGFKAEASTWPAIAERQAGPLEEALGNELGKAQDSLGDDLGNHLADKAAQAAQAAKVVTNGIAAAMKPFDKPIAPKLDLPKTAALDVKTSLDPANLELAITPKIEHAKIIRSGSAESQAARFSQQFASAAQIASITGNGGGAASPHIPGLPATAAAVQKAGDEKLLEQAKLQNQWLYKIELNARTDTASIVDF